MFQRMYWGLAEREGRGGREGGREEVCRDLHTLTNIYLFPFRILISDISIWVWDPPVYMLSWEPSM